VETRIRELFRRVKKKYEQMSAGNRAQYKGRRLQEAMSVCEDILADYARPRLRLEELEHLICRAVLLAGEGGALWEKE